MRTCVCDNCGMEFEVEHLDVEKDTMKNGHEVEVISFTCPKCDEKFIIAVRDETSAQIQKELQDAKAKYYDSYDPAKDNTDRNAKRDMEFKKRQLGAYMHKLKKKYLKEMRKRG